MYGVEVLEKIKAMKPDARVIVATADIQKSTADQVRTAGAMAIINKPINRKKLAETIDAVFQGKPTWN
jgi:two-component system, chemotaxis family, chemotaxis protein CheY